MVNKKGTATRFLCAVPKCDPAGTRTQDPYIKSVLLYQLSYGIDPPSKHVHSLEFWECKNKDSTLPAKFYPLFYPSIFHIGGLT